MGDRKEKKEVQANPVIEPIINGPFRVKNLNNLNDSNGYPIETKPTMYLCRCGGSSSKPFCDGAHHKMHFNSAKAEDRIPDRVDSYTGMRIIIYDNRSVCAHAGFCTAYSPAVFDDNREPWIEPDADDIEKTVRTVEMCPSGALYYTKDGVLHKDQEREPCIKVSENGPYYVTGSIKLDDPENSEPESKEHYTLCKCGKSKNKPFCDGAH